MDDPVQREPTEDAGSETQARYRFQSEVTARRCIAILSENAVTAIICEWHTDYVVLYSDGKVELVSVKHQEPSQQRWTLPQLLDAGGLNTLYQRWKEAGRTCRCTLETNAGMRTGQDQPAALANALASGNEQTLSEWAARLRVPLNATDEDALRFLKALRIDSGLPHRDHIRSVNIDQHLRPMLAQFALESADARDIYDRLVSVVEEANRDEGVGESIAAALGQPDRLDRDSQLKQRIARRTIDRDRLIEALRPRSASTVPLALARGRQRRMDTPLVQKLREGGVGATGISNAQNLRASWLTFRAMWSTGLPGDRERFDDLAARAIDVAQRAEREAKRRGAPWGDAMAEVLEQSLTVDAIGGAATLPLEDKQLLGLVYQLTDDCRIWWSDEFELEKQ